MQCCPKEPSPSREIPRDLHEHARDVARRLIRTKAFLKSRDERRRFEMRFARLKIYRGFERMRVRGPSGARLTLTHEHHSDPEMCPYQEPISGDRRESLLIGAAAGVMNIY